MRLLLSGFEPFGGERVNPSWEVARAVAASPPDGVEAEALLLPVRAGAALDVLWPAFEAGAFDAWLGLGQAGGRTHLSVERTGVNVLTDRDASGRALPEAAVVAGAPAARFARLPVHEAAAAMRAAGAPAQVSESAGTYICNEALFAMLDRLDAAGSAAPAGFVHLPYLPEQTLAMREGAPSMALETQALGVRAAAAFLRGLAARGERAAVASSAAR